MKRIITLLLLCVLMAGCNLNNGQDSNVETKQEINSISEVTTIDELLTYLDITETGDREYKHLGANRGVAFRYKIILYEVYQFEGKDAIDKISEATKLLDFQNAESLNDMLVVCHGDKMLTDVVK